MSALVCPVCEECWPNGKKFLSCPRCECETVVVHGEQALSSKEADQLVGCYDGFRRWLAKHPERKVLVVDLSRFDLIAELERIPTLGEAA